MRKIIMWDMVSVDGFFETPDHDISWFVFEDELAAYIGETQMEAGTLLFGRATYETMAAYWPAAEGDIATFMNGIEKFVFSRTLKSADWHNTTLVSGDAVAQVERLKELDGGTIFIFGSADFAATLTAKGLVDEYRLGINPVLLGKGVPLFQNIPERTNLKLTHTRPLKSGVVILHYQPQSA
ncbi:dihydrofolate reductase family protein [Sinorhizobium mexicanum]|uniref:Dihydrofolate reductase n=1 Tax=Sinorhizobium mexicanum TaxID=375549 RepID=A0A859QR70_9HYPH|nr:dihydrofolate reductase family protein [Sinorhizobium mexicanum]MBP1885161.1 dihydrofolate reductase [Sinorhizobium mexicanum]QLL62996.1 dihydrofolate reductase [Sinorhizobium mexicanum]